MSWWSWYFLAKGALYFKGYIPLSVGWNLLFAAFLLVPTPERLARLASVRIGRSVLHGVLAAVLMWHDSWLPPLPEAVRFVANGGLPTVEFVVGFLLGSVNFWIVGGLAALVFITVVAHRYIRLAPVVFALLLVIGVLEFTKPSEAMDGVVRSFLSDEAAQVTAVSASDEENPVFDLVFLHVCSLSWDDLRVADVEPAALFGQFDYVLTDFNSVTSHSTIAALRLLRSTCGQTSQEALYRRGNPDCYLLDALRDGGYQTWLAMNHDGQYMGFERDVKLWGHADEPLRTHDLPIVRYDFSGGPLRSDLAILERWLSERTQAGSSRAALYYNTTTLHIGGKLVQDVGPAAAHEERYRTDVDQLFAELEKFFALLASSGRNTVVFLVSEHGAALRGTKFQPTGLREIPLPTITNVPVAIKLIPGAFSAAPRPQRVITTPTSYRSLPVFVGEFLKRNPFDPGVWSAGPPDVRVPEVGFLAENEGVRVLKEGQDFFVKQRSVRDHWVKVPAEIAM